MQNIRTRNPDVMVHAIEFVADQEPREPEDFVSDLYVSFSVKGKTLARMFKKQARVLQRFLEELEKKPNSNKLIDRTVGDDRDVLKAISPLVQKEVQDYLVDEFDFEGRFPRMNIDWDVDTSWKPSIKIDPKNETIIITNKQINAWSR